MRTLNRIYNFFMKLFFRFAPKKVVFTGKKTTYDLNLATKQWSYFEPDLFRWTSPDCVKIIDKQICVSVEAINKFMKIENEFVYCKSKRGWAHFPGLDYSKPFGTWEVKFSYDKGCRPAVWMLRENYAHPETSIHVTGTLTWDEQIQIYDLPEFVILNWYVFHDGHSLGRITAIDGNFIKVSNPLFCSGTNKIFTISKDNITPEVDIFELIDGMYTQTIHHGLVIDKYEKYAFGSKVCHEKKGEIIHVSVAVTITPKGYKFYIDNVLSCEVWEGMSDEPLYMILSNVLDEPELKTGVYSMMIHEINFYE